MPVAEKSEDSVVRKAFGSDPQVKLENGEIVRIPKWSVRKAIAMGDSIAEIVKQFFTFASVEQAKSGTDLFAKAAEEALSAGMKPDDPNFPKEEDFNDEAQADVAGQFFAAIPKMIKTCSDELANIIVQSLTLPNGEQQLNKTDVLDDLSLDDFAELLHEIIKRNITKKTVKKWRNLFTGIPGILGN